MGKKLSELTAATDLSDTDLMHLRTALGIDKKITGANIADFILDNSTIRQTVTIAENIDKGEPVGRAEGAFYKSQFAWKVEDFSVAGVASGVHYNEVVDLGNNLIAICYFDIGSTQLEIQVLEYTGSTFTLKDTYGPLDNSGQGSQSMVRIEDTGNGPAFACFFAAGYLQFFEYNTSGESIAEITDALLIATGASGAPGDICYLGNDYVMTAFEYNSTVVEIRVCRFDGSSTIETTTSIVQIATVSAQNPRICSIGNNRAAISYFHGTTGDTLMIYRWDGSTSLEKDAAEHFTGVGVASLYRDVVPLGENKFVWLRPNNTAAPGQFALCYCEFGPADVVSDEDGRIAVSPPHIFAANSIIHVALAELSNNRVVIGIDETNSDNYRYGVFQWMGGGWSNIVPFVTGHKDTGGGFIQMCSFGDNMFVAAQKSFGGPGLYLHAGRVPNFIGIAEATITATNPVDILKMGRLSGLSGLVAGNDYFVDYPNGNIAEHGSIRVGQAESDIQLFVNI